MRNAFEVLSESISSEEMIQKRDGNISRIVKEANDAIADVDTISATTQVDGVPLIKVNDFYVVDFMSLVDISTQNDSDIGDILNQIVQVNNQNQIFPAIYELTKDHPGIDCEIKDHSKPEFKAADFPAEALKEAAEAGIIPISPKNLYVSFRKSDFTDLVSKCGKGGNLAEDAAEKLDKSINAMHMLEAAGIKICINDKL